MKRNFFADARWRPFAGASPRMGIDWGDVLDFGIDIATEAPDIWQAYQEEKVAEELRKAEEAKAAAEKARAEAEATRAKAEAEKARAEAEAADTIAGLPSDVVVYGGLGLGLLGAVGIGIALLG